jgi:glycosyltransferase involved in cell wall biosynthesis
MISNDNDMENTKLKPDKSALVSVAIPADNCERAIKSVLAQDYPSVELVVVDDASQDKTAETAERAAAGRIKLIKHAKNLGGTAARNTGINAAGGQYGRRRPAREAKKIKVLHIIKTLNPGGAETNLYNLAGALDPAVVECHVAYSSGGPYEAMLSEKSVQLFKYESKERRVKSPVSVLIILKLILYILRHRIKVVQTHNYNAHVWGSIAARICGARVVEHVHDSRYESSAFLRERGLQETSQFNQAKYFARLSDRIVVLTRSNRDYLIDNGIVPPERVRVLFNGIPLDSNGFHGNGLRYELGIPDGRKIVFTAMRLSPEKNAEMVIGIANLLRERNDVMFVVAGDGPQKAFLERKVKDKNLDKKVVFAGFRPDIKDLLGISDIFILPTLRELHSVSMIEAMSMRVPVLVSEGAGCNDYFIESGVNGFLLNPRFAEEWATAIKLLLEDGQLRKRIGEAGRKLVEKECDVRKIAGDFTGIYAELCGLKI